jgi:hypothetical protein
MSRDGTGVGWRGSGSHDVAWEFDAPGGEYTGRMLIDGEI